MRMTRTKVVVFVTAMIFLSTFSFYGYQMLNAPNILSTHNGKISRSIVYLYIPKGATFKTVLDSLERHDALEDKLSFAFLAKLMGYQENVKTGRYKLHPDMSNKELLYMLRAGRQEPIQLVVPPLRKIDNILRWLDKQLMISAEEIEQAMQQWQDTLRREGLDSTSYWCIFLPNTYEVYWDVPAPRLIERMLREYRRFWNEERRQKAKAIGMTPHEVMTLASIVQAETNKADEMPRIAGVYINRLRQNMFLQADPTVVHAVGDYSIRRVLKEHLTVDSPYNTYKYKGLPPGPIGIPTPQAIDAVLNYELHDYLYFCAKDDFSGYHLFAKNYNEHLRNARRYQRAVSQLLRKKNE
ncbi:endolytic transglycosylase MltG [Thermonema rossianum]|uniref:endolytic transglycosylase MltG n=1 Tax=Thermonema rossianum TaxID=55505 RepID=UPI000A00C113|nr:endolytic transglycosylase MltG [Thermonema rossianum]